MLQTPKLSATKICIKVNPAQQRKLLAPINLPAGDGAAIFRMVVHCGWHHETFGTAGIPAVALIAFHNVPAVVLSAAAGCILEIHFLNGILAHIGQIQIPGQAVEAETPGVSQAQGPDLFPCPGERNKRIVRRDAIGRACVHINSQHLARQGIQIPARIHHDTICTAVSRADVEISGRTECQMTTIVVTGWRGNCEQNMPGAFIGQVIISG